MIFNAKSPLHISKAKIKFNKLIESGKTFELTEKMPVRTMKQNRYAHLLFAFYAVQTGYTAAEAKQYIFKQIVNPTIFYDGEFKGLQRWRSTKDLDKAEMTTALKRLQHHAAIEGYYLPVPEDLENLTDKEILEFQEIEQQINSVKEYI